MILAALAAASLTLPASAQKVAENNNHRADEVILHWNNASAPHSNHETRDEQINARGDFSCTSQTVFYLYKADESAKNGQSVVILPGGGYTNVCIAHEGFKLAEWFSAQGITALVVKYRLPNFGHMEVPLEDAQAAMAYLRKNAKKLGIDPAQVGICGSSAGGHLAAYTSTFTEDADKPAFSVLFYPVITGTTWATHHGTFARLLGNDRTPAEQEYYSLENRVGATTPPAILLLSDNDRVVPPVSSLRYYEALKNHGVKASMHIYPSGGHGWAGHDDFKYAEECKAAIKDWLNTLQEKNNKQ